MHFSAPILLLASILAVRSSALNIPREPAPLPAGCSGQSYQATTSAAAASECAASGCQTCLTPFENGGFWYAVCECNVSDCADVGGGKGGLWIDG
ncbi:hypothetical protein BDR22DRAFT_844073 [Usnea florida]